MKAESVVIHKGGKEEKYRIYVEDYVISYLKSEAGTLDLSEMFFYGYSDREAEEFIIYGAGRDRQIAVFDKYNLLDKITCRLTQAGPVFLIREKTGLYEAKGYDIFYHKNEEMQSYLVDSRQQYHKTEKTEEQQQRHISVDRPTPKPEDNPGKQVHNAVSLQLGVIFILLIAIVINSTNSYDKMKQLNQSAKEVFFALENQEAENTEPVDMTQQEQNIQNITVDRNVQEEGILKPVAEDSKEVEEEETTEDSQSTQDKAADDEKFREESTDEKTFLHEVTDDKAFQQEETADNEKPQEETAYNETFPEEEETEALSRSVTRYYEIERGDTLYTISEKIYGDISKVKEICELNDISDPDDIRYGQKIILP